MDPILLHISCPRVLGLDMDRVRTLAAVQAHADLVAHAWPVGRDDPNAYDDAMTVLTPDDLLQFRDTKQFPRHLLVRLVQGRIDSHLPGCDPVLNTDLVFANQRTRRRMLRARARELNIPHGVAWGAWMDTQRECLNSVDRWRCLLHTDVWQGMSRIIERKVHETTQELKAVLRAYLPEIVKRHSVVQDLFSCKDVRVTLQLALVIADLCALWREWPRLRRESDYLACIDTAMYAERPFPLHIEELVFGGVEELPIEERTEWIIEKLTSVFAYRTAQL